MVANDFRASGMARYLLKDLDFATDVATTTRTDTALLPALRAAFADLVARGFGDHDMAVKVISRLEGSGRKDAGGRPAEQLRHLREAVRIARAIGLLPSRIERFEQLLNEAEAHQADTAG